ncbi:MAG: helix-turn-helix transcriptional regulator [Lachnospiraceae bacterium]|nr:helix-turn-helix transcriptional regulator [Lachnospiraceae bacterium]
MGDYVISTDEFAVVLEGEQRRIKEEVARQYIACRKQKKMTQADVAAVAGMKRPNITRFETGDYNPTIDMLVKVAECMGMTVEIKLVEKAKA